MAKTRHIQKRMDQRNIDQRLLELAQDFGKRIERGETCKTILNRQAIDKAVERLDNMRRDLDRARKKGGIVVVSTVDGVDITTYRLDSYRRSEVRVSL